MVGAGTIISVCITLFITLVLPVIIYIVYGVKKKGKGVWTAWLLGAAGFFVMQIILRTPILNILSLTSGFMDFVANHYILYCVFAALTAALFEVVGRFAVAKILAKKMTAEKAFAAGLGHGSIESMFLIGMTYVNNLAYIALINMGQFDGIVEQTAALGVDTTALFQVKETLVGANPGIFLLAGYERVLTIILHIALSMVVCYFVANKKSIKGVLIVLACHFAVDFVAGFVSGMATTYMGNLISQTMSYVLAELFLTVVCVISVVTIKKLYKKMQNMVIM